MKTNRFSVESARIRRRKQIFNLVLKLTNQKMIDESNIEDAHVECISTSSTSSPQQAPLNNETIPDVTVTPQASSSVSPVTFNVKDWPTLPVTPESIKRHHKT